MNSFVDVQKLIDEGDTIGAILRGERMTLGKTLEDVNAELKIRIDDLKAMESNNLSAANRPEFLAGSIRTYAKYLNLDPKSVLTVYKEQYGLDATAPTPSKVSPKMRHKNTAMNVGYYKEPPRSGFSKFTLGFSKLFLSLTPLLLLVGGATAAVFFGVRFFTSVQQLQVVPTESQPDFANAAQVDASDAVASANFSETPTINYDELYARQALSVPVIQLRDGPIAEIGAPSVSDSGEVEVAAVEPANEPMVSVGPIVPKVELLPLGEAWVQLNTEAGDTIFEKLLKPGEVVPIPLEGSVNFLKAGNATQLYVRVNGEVFGPIGQDGNSVIRNVPMLPTELKVNFEAVTPEKLADLQSLETSYLAKLEAQ